MRKCKQLIIGLCLGSALSITGVKAQFSNDSSLVTPLLQLPIETEVRMLPQNPTAIHYFPITRLSIAEIGGQSENGKLINYYQADKLINTQAFTESYRKISPDLVVHGLVSYQYSMGENMGGSAFIAPDNAPLNIVEYADTTRGKKQKEKYQLLGEISYNMQNKLRLGASVDYKTANYAKRKDLRHRNKLLDLTAILGATYPITPAIEVGGNYFYRKRVEGVYFDVYGELDKSYSSLIDFGGFYGKSTGFYKNGDGYTSGRTERPLTDTYHGAALQLNWKINPKTILSNEVFYYTRNGFYGKKSSSNVVYTDHKGRGWKYNGAISYKNNRTWHIVKLNMMQEKLSNAENVFQYNTTSDGITQVIYHGANEVLKRTQRKMNFTYALLLDVNELVPKYEINLAAILHSRNQTTSLYPFFRKQNLAWGTLQLDAKRNFRLSKNLFSVFAGTSFSKGKGEPYTDGTYTQPAATEVAPQTTKFNLVKEYDYLTALTMGAELGLQYIFRYKRNVAPYVKIKSGYHQSFSTENHLYRLHYGISLGCLF